MVMSQSSGDRQVAVLIDDENVSVGSVEWLFDQVSNLGRILIRRAYSDWSKGGRVRDQLLEFGIEPVHVFQASSSGKNASDIRLAIDAIDLLQSSPVDTFVVVSGDADFVPLVNKLRSHGMMVIGAGLKKSTSDTLVKACDRYFFLDQQEEKDEEDEVAEPQPKKRSKSSLIVRAVQASMDNEGKVMGSRLHDTMQRLDPSFDFRSQGFKSFTAFLESSDEVEVTRPTGPGDVVIELLSSGQDNDTHQMPLVASIIDAEWSKRAPKRGDSMPGAVAAGDAAKVLGASKLSDSEHKNLQRLLDAMPQLAKNWRRDGNTISRK